jgi:predicted transcriptional regulator
MRQFSKIQRDILSLLKEKGPMHSTDIRKALGVRFIGVNTYNMLRNFSCIESTGDLRFKITDIGITAAETGLKP